MNESTYKILVLVALFGILAVNIMSFVFEQRQITRGDYLSAKPDQKKEMLDKMPIVVVRGEVDVNLDEPIAVVVEGAESQELIRVFPNGLP